MAKSPVATVESYLASQPPATRAVLERVRAVIRKAVPTVEECISYQIPAYKLPGGTVIHFAGWKAHFSLYPASALVVETLGDELAGRPMSKGTIRFALDERVPVGLIGRIVKLRVKEVRARAAAKTHR
ncbi:MAG: DUF1801 domain-containing protein [Acidobacteria bacterium]|nr:DUF1801 domain-containing protein [Acidobacteriota bacterium]